MKTANVRFGSWVALVAMVLSCGRDAGPPAGETASDTPSAGPQGGSGPVGQTDAGERDDPASGASFEAPAGTEERPDDPETLLTAYDDSKAAQRQVGGLESKMQRDSIRQDSLRQEVLPEIGGERGRRPTFGTGEMIRVPAGTRITVAADEEISTETHPTGAAVVTTLAEDVTTPDGTVLIPRCTKVLGRVTASESSYGPGEDPVLEIDFETLSAATYERPVRTIATRMEVRLGRRNGPVNDFPVPGVIPAGDVIVVELRALRVPLWPDTGIAAPARDSSQRPGDSPAPGERPDSLDPLADGLTLSGPDRMGCWTPV